MPEEVSLTLVVLCFVAIGVARILRAKPAPQRTDPPRFCAMCLRSVPAAEWQKHLMTPLHVGHLERVKRGWKHSSHA